MYAGNQTTILNNISFFGNPKDSDKIVNVKLIPSTVNSGIIFKRIDLSENNEIKVDFENAIIENNILLLKNKAGITVKNLEPILVSLWACRIDNILVEIDGDTLPYIDGTSEPIIFLLNSAKTKDLDEIRGVCRVENECDIAKDGIRIRAKPSRTFVINVSDAGEKFEFDNKILPFKDYLSKINETCSNKAKYDVVMILALTYLSGEFFNTEVEFDGFDKQMTLNFFKELWSR